MQNPKTLPALISAMTESLEDSKAEILDSQYPDDLVHEIVDGWVPIYYGELAEMLCCDHSLANVDDTGLIDPDSSVWAIISVAIYERLSDAANEWLEKQKGSTELLQRAI